ncbi:hypothetical protein [Glycomyces terrestris]|uniref:WXG100 family type VII secretion target n=1 Tax=Glycomyces terrestris TaxID=2493553 RepID=A0A426V3A3_9ACTN|nr:hypothetical protein [Glycomyces terrestris]RRS01373.1 hypothetical protein EIW28_00940 [Glycomyces terrestris]
MEQVEPLRQWLDDLAGEADVIASHVETWKNIGQSKLDYAERLQAAVDQDLADWRGEAADAYRAKIQHGVNAAAGLAGTAYAMAAATEAAGVLVATTRDIVRELVAGAVATLVVRVPMWCAEAGIATVTLGSTAPAVVAQVTGFVAGKVARIVSYLIALQESLAALRKLMEW